MFLNKNNSIPTQKFYIREFADHNSLNIKEINIPKNCPDCNHQLDVLHSPLKENGLPICPSYFANPLNCSGCRKIFTIYKTIWNTYSLLAPYDGSSSVKPNGINCKKCNMRNEWAVPNKDDGTYLCFECR